MESIFKRRSIRKFTQDAVKEEDIQKIIEAGMASPSAGNERPWHFLIIKERDSLLKLSQVSPYSKMVAQSSCSIVVLADLNLEIYKGFWVQDCSAAVQNMLLMISALGLGSVWLGVYPLEDRVNYLKKMLNLPENILPFAIIPIGYPAEFPGKADRFDEKRIHREQLKL